MRFFAQTLTIDLNKTFTIGNVTDSNYEIIKCICKPKNFKKTKALILFTKTAEIEKKNLPIYLNAITKL